MVKRGVSHIEIILSFAIFVSAIGFALFFFRPTNTTRLAETSLDYIFREINNNASIIVRVYSVKIDNGSIIKDNNNKEILKINFKDAPIDDTSYAMIRNGTYLKSKWSKEGLGEQVFVEVESPSGWWQIDFIYILFGPEFIEEKLNGGALNKDYFTIGSSYSDNVISWNRTLALKDFYDKNYFDLKDKFNIPRRVNFGFILNVTNAEIKAENTIPKGLEVFAEQKAVKILKDGKISYGNLIVKVW